LDQDSQLPFHAEKAAAFEELTALVAALVAAMTDGLREAPEPLRGSTLAVKTLRHRCTVAATGIRVRAARGVTLLRVLLTRCVTLRRYAVLRDDDR
jgi:hypothetical protein